MSPRAGFNSGMWEQGKPSPRRWPCGVGIQGKAASGWGPCGRGQCEAVLNRDGGSKAAKKRNKRRNNDIQNKAERKENDACIEEKQC